MLVLGVVTGGMGVSAIEESGETFPTRILNLEIYWEISPVKTGETGNFPSKKPIQA